jgi:hypothetical protein
VVLVVPVGRCAGALRLPPVLAESVDVMPATALEARHLPGRSIVLCVPGGRDEACLGLVARVFERLRPHGLLLPMVAYRPPAPDATRNRAHLARLALAWPATTVAGR